MDCTLRAAASRRPGCFADIPCGDGTDPAGRQAAVNQQFARWTILHKVKDRSVSHRVVSAEIPATPQHRRCAWHGPAAHCAAHSLSVTDAACAAPAGLRRELTWSRHDDLAELRRSAAERTWYLPPRARASIQTWPTDPATRPVSDPERRFARGGAGRRAARCPRLP
jgi:hypothetical protein